MTQRKIIHIDMDAFFVSVEERDRPALATRPIAVGGLPEARGVICTANYIARQYGVRSAISSHRAMQLCPELLILYPNIEKYSEESKAIRAIFRQYTDKIEPLSLDEAYLDVTDSPYCRGSATWIAHAIRMQIYRERGLTASAGVAPNKFLAKVASDWNKPNGQYVIPPLAVAPFVEALPVEQLWGVGEQTTKLLHELRIYTCGELQKVSLIDLAEALGPRAMSLKQLARGVDEREVSNGRIRKSISVEDTFPHDLPTLESCRAELPKLIERLLHRYRSKEGLPPIRKLFVKLKFADFQQTTAECHRLQEPTVENFTELLETGWQRQQQPVRLLGVGLTLDTASEQQLTFW